LSKKISNSVDCDTGSQGHWVVKSVATFLVIFTTESGLHVTDSNSEYRIVEAYNKNVCYCKQTVHQHSHHKKIGQSRRHDQPLVFLSSSLITMVDDVVAVSRIICMHVGGPKKFGGRCRFTPCDGGMADPYKHASPSQVLPYHI